MELEVRQCREDGGQTLIGDGADDGQAQCWVRLGKGVGAGGQEVEYGKRATLWQCPDIESEKPGHTDLEWVSVAS